MGIVQEKRNDNKEIPDNLDIFFDVSYKGMDGNPLHADIYRKKKANNLPVIIMVHGGGLFLGETRSSRPIAEYYASEGYLVAVISYRLLQESDGISIISDVLAGYNFVYNHIEEFGGDPQKIFVTGESAGAFLAIMANSLSASSRLAEALELEASKLKITAMALFSGMIYTNRFDRVGLVYRKDLYGNKIWKKGFRKLIDPEGDEILNNMPPLLMSTSAGDFLQKYTLDYKKVLSRRDKTSVLINYPDKNLVHAFPIVEPSKEESKEVHRRVIAFFNQYVGLSSSGWLL